MIWAARLFLAASSLMLFSCAENDRQLVVPIRLVRLEPKTTSRLSRVGWVARTADGKSFSGSAEIGSNGSIRFGFPSDRQIDSLVLEGFDSTGLLRAGGQLTSTDLADASETDPAILFFHLYDEFQAFSDTMGPPLFRHQVYPDVDGGIVTFGGSSGAEARDEVERIDPETGQTTLAGRLARRRTRSGVLELPDGRYVVAGGLGNADSSTTAEIFDPATKTGVLVPGALQFPRINPDVFRLSNGQIWIVDGAFSGDGGNLPAEIISSAAVIGTSSRMFPGGDGRTTFIDPGNGTDRIVRWPGFSGEVNTYFPGNVNPVSTVIAPSSHYHPARIRVASETVLFSGFHAYCSNVTLVGANGDPAGAVVFDLNENLCSPAVAAISSTTLLVLGGADDTQLANPRVRTFDLTTGSFSDEVTPAGALQRLVYPRMGARAVRIPDGRVFVIGGATRVEDGTLDPDLTPLPRVEVRVPSPGMNMGEGGNVANRRH